MEIIHWILNDLMWLKIPAVLLLWGVVSGLVISIFWGMIED